MKGGTPGEAAKVNAPFSEWADVVRGGTVPKVTVVESESQRVKLDLDSVPKVPRARLDLTGLGSRARESRRHADLGLRRMVDTRERSGRGRKAR